MDDKHVVFSRALLKRFILTYKEHRCLWDRSSPEYKNRKLKHNATAILTQLVKEHDSNATPVHVMRKIESLRACVRREHKKVKRSYQTARSPEDIYVPNLWYYDLFSFVREDDPELKILKTEIEEHITDNEESIGEESIDCEESNSDIIKVDYQQTAYDQPEGYEIESPAPSIVEVSVRSHSRNISEMDHSYKMQKKEVDDEYDAIGLIVASKLRGLQPSMRIIAEKLINDVLYQAQTNELNTSSAITTADPFK